MTSFTKDERERYKGHFSLPHFGPEGQLKLKHTRVLCVGCGGLAATAAIYLAAAGVGTLGLMDADIVSISNLQRQILFGSRDVGHKKAEVLAHKIADLTPHVHVEMHPMMLSADNAEALISQFDLILDCTDTFPAKYLINEVCFRLKKPFVYASVFQFEGQVCFFDGREGPCFQCLAPTPPAPGLSGPCSEVGILGALPGMMGTMQAMEAIKYIVGLGEVLQSKLFFIDTLRQDAKTFAFEKSESCPICYPEKNAAPQSIKAITARELAERRDEVYLIDVREPAEHAETNIGGHLIPLATLESTLSSLDKTKAIVVYCRRGPRSQHAAKILMDHGFQDVAYLLGGLSE